MDVNKHRYSVDIFYIPVLWENWVLAESRITFKPVLGVVRILYFPLALVNKLYKKKPSLLFSKIEGYLYF